MLFYVEIKDSNGRVIAHQPILANSLAEAQAAVRAGGLLGPGETAGTIASRTHFDALRVKGLP